VNKSLATTDILSIIEKKTIMCISYLWCGNCARGTEKLTIYREMREEIIPKYIYIILKIDFK
jgi:hypothetical protein